VRCDPNDGSDDHEHAQPALNVEPVEIQSRYGPIKAFDETDLISRFLTAFGEWSQLEVEFLAQFVEATDCVFDVGAFIGTFSLGLHKMSPFRSCVAVELNPASQALLCSNLDRNLAADHDALNAAVGGAEAGYVQPDGLRAFLNPKNMGSLQLDKPTRHADQYSEVLLDVPLASLKTLRREYGDYDFLKLDVEGAEWDALRTDSVWIRDRHPVLWLECNEDVRSLKLIEFLNWAEYDAHYFAYPAWNPDNYFGTAQSLYPFAFEAGLLGIHGRPAPQLSVELAEKGCLLQRISSRSELRDALWATPRWGLRDWETRSRTQLAALMARILKGEEFKAFLDD
jgi:FkbM family methyltransferase